MVGDWEQKRPIWILYILSSLTEENIRLRKIPLLDQFMDNAAEGLGKTVQAVETPRDQCRPLNRLSNQQVRKNNNNCYYRKINVTRKCWNICVVYLYQECIVRTA